jgi:hypothetical protein
VSSSGRIARAPRRSAPIDRPFQRSMYVAWPRVDQSISLQPPNNCRSTPPCCAHPARALSILGLDGRSLEAQLRGGRHRTGPLLSSRMAAGIEGVCRFDGSAKPKVVPIPRFEAVGGVGVSFALPDVVLVLTAVNQRRSISGSVPIIGSYTRRTNSRTCSEAVETRGRSGPLGASSTRSAAREAGPA